MKSLKFRGFKAQMILDGTKTASLRLFDDKNLTAEDELELINSDTGKLFANAVVTEVIAKPLGEISAADLEGHEPYGSHDEMLKNLRGHYGDRVNDSTPAKIIRFALRS